MDPLLDLYVTMGLIVAVLFAAVLFLSPKVPHEPTPVMKALASAFVGALWPFVGALLLIAMTLSFYRHLNDRLSRRPR